LEGAKVQLFTFPLKLKQLGVELLGGLGESFKEKRVFSSDVKVGRSKQLGAGSRSERAVPQFFPLFDHVIHDVLLGFLIGFFVEPLVDRDSTLVKQLVVQRSSR